ncbi:MAG: hypothetical protein MJ237_01735 [bacterium]|nr:hypothetical protein [bacterium]
MFTIEEGIMQNTSNKPLLTISDSITKNWTEQALECYRLNGNCAECSIIKGHYSFECQMPKVVEILKVVAGEPDINE